MSNTAAAYLSENQIDFRTAYCKVYDCSVDEFEPRVLRQTLFWHARFLRALVRPMRPESFFAEYLLIKQAGDKILISDVRGDVDFYQHKYVNGFMMRESLKVRVSGRRLIGLARRVFKAAQK